MAQSSTKEAKDVTMPLASAPVMVRVDVPRSLLSLFSQPEVHVSVDDAARALGFPNEKELRKYVEPLLKRTDKVSAEPLGSHVGALAFKRLIALCAAKMPAARSLLEDLLGQRVELVSLPAAPLPVLSAVPRWPGCAPELVGMDKGPFDRLNKYFEWRTRMKHFSGITCGVVRNGMLVHYQEAGYASAESKSRMTGDTIVRLFSMTKCLVAAAFMAYAEDPAFGIDLDDPVDKYIPAFAASKMSVLPKRGQKENQPLERAITVRQLLTHTSGIGYGATLGDPWPPGKGAYYKIYEELCENTSNGQIKSLEEWCNVLAKVPLKGQPGQFWDYSYSLDVLGRILEIVSGKPLDVVVQEKVCGPLKMRDTSFAVPLADAARVGPWYKSTEVEGKPSMQHTLEVVDKGGAESGWVGPNVSKVLSGGGTVEVPLAMRGGMVSTFHDYLRFLLMLRNFGELDGVRVLKRETVQLMICNHIPAACNGKKTVFVFNKPGLGYNFLGSIQAANPKQDKGSCSGEYGWGGLAGPAWTIDPRSDLIILSMTQTAFVLDHEEYLRYAARRAIHQYYFGSVAAPSKATSASPECFDVERPKPAVKGVKDEQAAMDKEFEEEFTVSRMTRSRSAKECAILPGARMDRHPSDEEQPDAVMGRADSAPSGGIPGPAAQETEATPAAKRRRSTNGVLPGASDVAAPSTGAKVVSPSNAKLPKAPPTAAKAPRLPPPSPPAMPEPGKELLFQRVLLKDFAEGSDEPVAAKARVTAIEGDAVEVITEGSWSVKNVSKEHIQPIEETQFGVSVHPQTGPTEFPMAFPSPPAPASEQPPLAEAHTMEEDEHAAPPVAP